MTDAALAAVPPGVRELSLVCCERVTGWGLTRLAALRALRLPGCSAIELRAVQARSFIFVEHTQITLYSVLAVLVLGESLCCRRCMASAPCYAAVAGWVDKC